MTDYKPGDVANGHVLGNDNVWHPIAATPSGGPASPPPPPPPTANGQGDGEKKNGNAIGCISLIAIIAFIGIISDSCSGDDDKQGDSKPTTSASTDAKSAAKAEAEAKAAAEARKKAAAEKQAKIDNATFPSEHDLALVFKDPDSHVGEIFQVWGSVMQFDAATGNDSFLAQTANRNTTSYGYFDGENAAFTGNASDFKDLVEDDVFTATVEVEGSMSYDTQIGGNTTVPKFVVKKLTRQ